MMTNGFRLLSCPFRQSMKSLADLQKHLQKRFGAGVCTFITAGRLADTF